MMKRLSFSFVCAAALLVSSAYGDLVLDNFDNDRSPANGEGVDTWWNPPGDPTFIPSLETEKVFDGEGALKVSWEDKGLFPAFQIANLHINGNNSRLFQDADAVRMRIAGDGGRIIMKLRDANGNTTGDISEVMTSGSDEFEAAEFPYYEMVVRDYPEFDLTQVAEIQLLIDAGNRGSSGEIVIDSIELILGGGDAAEVVGVIDNFDNDVSIEDALNAPDSLPSGISIIAQEFAPFVFSVVDDPAGGENAVLQIDFNISPFNVIFITRLDVTDWRGATGVSIDVYGEVSGLLMKLQFDDLSESSDLPPRFQDHERDPWDTFVWTFDNVEPGRLENIRSLLFFVEGPTGGQGTLFVDNVTLLGDITRVAGWALY